MHSCLQFALCLVAFGNAMAGSMVDSNSNDEQPESELFVELRQEWNDFKSKFGKQYKDADEEHSRVKIFAAKMAEVKAHNLLYDQGLSSYQQGMNEFSDMTHSEFLIAKTCHKRLDPSGVERATETHVPKRVSKIPISVDWRRAGYVTPVKSQGNCGACSVFSITGTLEGQQKKKTDHLVALSAQQVVDCAFGEKGCEGHLPMETVRYIIQNGGIDTDASYPYEGQQGKCRFNKLTIGATIKDRLWVKDNERSLMEAVAEVGPISVSIDAAHESFEKYRGGIYDEPKCNKSDLNHAVLLVGYGLTIDTNEKYWLVKNSYGTAWGEGGYMRMVKDKNNQCGIASLALYVDV